MDVVREIVDMRKQEGYPHPDEEQLELKRMGEEAEEWIKLAALLLKGLAEEDKQETKPCTLTEKDEAASVEDKLSEKSSEKYEEKDREIDVGHELPDELPEEMSVIGVDDNIHSKSLQQAIEEVRGREGRKEGGREGEGEREERESIGVGIMGVQGACVP